MENGKSSKKFNFEDFGKSSKKFQFWTKCTQINKKQLLSHGKLEIVANSNGYTRKGRYHRRKNSETASDVKNMV